MARGTSPGIERCETVGEIGRIGPQHSRGDYRRYGEPPEHGNADGRGNNQSQESQLENVSQISLANWSQHSSIRHYPPYLTAGMAAGRAINCLNISRTQDIRRE
jgi:hypothetical protein